MKNEEGKMTADEMRNLIINMINKEMPEKEKKESPLWHCLLENETAAALGNGYSKKENVLACVNMASCVLTVWEGLKEFEKQIMILDKITYRSTERILELEAKVKELEYKDGGV